MGYRKRFEDSYLDEEDEEFDGDDKTDAERIVALIEKPIRTPKEDQRVNKLTERLFNGARLPDPVGGQAIFGLEMVASAYANLGMATVSAELWARLSDTAQAIGNKELYYKSMDALADMGATADT